MAGISNRCVGGREGSRAGTRAVSVSGRLLSNIPNFRPLRRVLTEMTPQPLTPCMEEALDSESQG